MIFDKYSEPARRALFFARIEAGRLGRTRIESEHVLLGVLREEDPVTRELWSGFGFDASAIIAQYPDAAAETPKSEQMPVSEEVTRICESAVEEADQRGHADVRPVHLVLAMLRLPSSAAAAALAPHGVEYELVSEVVRVFDRHARMPKALVLGESHSALLDRLAAATGASRDSVVGAMLEALSDASFTSLDELREKLRRIAAPE